MPEDLTTAPEGEEITEEEIAEAEMEFTSRAEIIASCFNAISAVDGIDGVLLGNGSGEIYNKMKRRIQKRCIKILDTLVKEMYDETFFDDEEEKES